MLYQGAIIIAMAGIEGRTSCSICRCIIVSAALLMAAVPSGHAAVNAYYLYNLSDFNGTVLYDSPRIFADKDRSEIYVLYQNNVAVYNASGMEIYRFSFDAGSNHILDLALDKNGDILALSYTGSMSRIVRCNYRGVPRETFDISNVPAAFTPFFPNRLVFRQGQLYLASTESMKIAVVDANGRYLKGYDIVQLLELKEQDRSNTGIVGFSVDLDGNMLFTIPVLFSAYRLGSDGSVAGFGQPGSSPGKFNIVSGIREDGRGNYLVTDVLKHKVMVFDKDFKFIMQFGSYGAGPGELIGPHDLSVDAQDRVYVAQGGRRGVSVFRLAYD